MHPERLAPAQPDFDKTQTHDDTGRHESHCMTEVFRDGKVSPGIYIQH